MKHAILIDLLVFVIGNWPFAAIRKLPSVDIGKASVAN